MPSWKAAVFIGYNAIFLAGLFVYGKKLRGDRVKPSIKNL
jgi:hypothetical protein